MKSARAFLGKILIAAAIFISPVAASSQPGTPAPHHALFSALLADYVRDGAVDYAALCRDPRLPAYLQQLAVLNPDSLPTTEAQLAFWINAYNAYTLKVICDHYPLRSINDLHLGGLFIGALIGKTVWDQPLAVINGHTYTLNQIEHEIIRKRFKEPRVHFALVCASKSCPPLRNEAFRGEKLDEQLEEQGRIFFFQRDKNRVDPAAKVIHLSRIIKWYRDDFGPDWPSVIGYISRFFPEPEATLLRTRADQWEVRFTRYDWTLNN